MVTSHTRMGCEYNKSILRFQRLVEYERENSTSLDTALVLYIILKWRVNFKKSTKIKYKNHILKEGSQYLLSVVPTSIVVSMTEFLFVQFCREIEDGVLDNLHFDF